MSIHDGHRQRLRERFCQEGLDGFNEVQALELLLFYCIPRRDTNPIAHALLERFGSFSQVLEAPAEELEKVSEVGSGAAAFLHLIREAGRYYQVNRASKITVLTTVEQCGEYMMPLFLGETNEVVYLLCMDAKCKVICCRSVAEGSINSAGISVRKIVETALNTNASSVVLAHNHPSGFAVPSPDDIQTTIRVAAALNAVGVCLVDHLVVADNDFTSMKQSGYRFQDVQLGDLV